MEEPQEVPPVEEKRAEDDESVERLIEILKYDLEEA